MRWKTRTICSENSHSISIKHLRESVLRKCLGRFAWMIQSQVCLSSKAHHPFDGISHKLLFYFLCQALNLAPYYDLSWLSCINMTEQMGPWKKRWKNKKLAVIISEENRVWTSKWRMRDNRDKCTCHQLVNQWWRKKNCGRELISTRVNKGITPWTNECSRCDRANAPCGYHNREGMLGSNGPLQDMVKHQKSMTHPRPGNNKPLRRMYTKNVRNLNRKRM